MRPLRILVVEDEMTIALMLEDMLVNLGHTVVGVALRLAHGVRISRPMPRSILPFSM